MANRWPSHFQPEVVKEGFGYRLSSYVLALEAWRRGLTVTLLSPTGGKYRVSDQQGREIVFFGSRPGLKKNAVIKDKYRTNQALTRAEIPTPTCVEVDPSSAGESEVEAIASKIGYPVVLKPRDGSRGRGVYPNITNGEVLRKRYRTLAQELAGAPLVIENHIPGQDYRVLIYEDRYVAACRREPASVTGDGASTVRELVANKNRDRRQNPFLSSGLIKRDREASDHLEQSGLTWDSVPAAGRRVGLRSAANASAGGDVVDVTDELPLEIQRTAIRAAQAIPGLRCAGVDVLLDAATGRYAILELNGLPQIGVNMYPSEGRGVDVPKKVLDLYFPDSPRTEDRSYETLALDRGPALDVLRSRHAAAVTLPPIPKHGYRSRYLFELEEGVLTTNTQRERLLRSARRHELAGFLRLSVEHPEVMVAGSELGIQQFIKVLEALLGVPTRNKRRWEGPVFAGLTID